MNASIRRIAVSGSAAVALLGGAAAITTASAPSASAAVQTTAAHHPVTAPVNLPDGRTMRITGMGGYGHQATGEHLATVAAFKTSTGPTDTPTIGTGLTPGTGAPVQNPVNGTPTGYTQQISTQSAGGYVATGVVGILLLAVVVFFRVKHKHLHFGDAVVGGLFGLALGGTVVGTMGHQLINSFVGSLGGMLGSLG